MKLTTTTMVAVAGAIALVGVDTNGSPAVVTVAEASFFGFGGGGAAAADNKKNGNNNEYVYVASPDEADALNAIDDTLLSAPMHVVFGSIPCYGHWNPLRSVAKAVFNRGHHVSLLMENDRMRWCTDAKTAVEAAVARRRQRGVVNNGGGGGGDGNTAYDADGSPFRFDINGGTFNCVPIPSSGTFKRDLFIGMSKSEDISASFDELFAEMFKFTNVTQDAFSRSIYVLRELTTGLVGASSASNSADANSINAIGFDDVKRDVIRSNAKKKKAGRNDENEKEQHAWCRAKKDGNPADAVARARAAGFPDDLIDLYCSGAVPPLGLMMTDAGTFPTYAAAVQFGVPSVSLFPLSVNLPAKQATHMPLLGSGRPSGARMTFFDRLATYTRRNIIMVGMKYLAIPHILGALRSEANERKRGGEGEATTTATITSSSSTSSLSATKVTGDIKATKKSESEVPLTVSFASSSASFHNGVAFPHTPDLPPFRGGLHEMSMGSSLIFTPGIWGYDVPHGLCGNVIAIGSTSVGDEGDDDVDADASSFAVPSSVVYKNYDGADRLYAERNLVVDRRLTEDSPLRKAAGDEEGSLPATPKAILARRAALEEPLALFLESSPACQQYGAVYVNFGTLSVLTPETFARVTEALWRVPFCVVWKITEAERFDDIKAKISAADSSSSSDGSNNGIFSPKHRFYIAKHFASPEAILEHHTTRAFISHCGDTSVLEAIHALVPIAGIPIFADQPDVCQRLDEAGIGTYVGLKQSFSVEKLVSTLLDLGLYNTNNNNNNNNFNSLKKKTLVGRRAEFLTRIHAVRKMSVMLGGPAKAAAVLEEHYSRGLFDAKRAMFRQAPVVDGVKAARIGLVSSSSPSSSAAFHHPYYAHPQACDAQRFPYVNKQIAREIEYGVAATADGSGRPHHHHTLSAEDEPSFVAISTLVNNLDGDMFFVVFVAVGVALFVAKRVAFALLRLLCRGCCSGGKWAAEAEGKSKVANKNNEANTEANSGDVANEEKSVSQNLSGNEKQQQQKANAAPPANGKKAGPNNNNNGKNGGGGVRIRAAPIRK